MSADSVYLFVNKPFLFIKGYILFGLKKVIFKEEPALSFLLKLLILLCLVKCIFYFYNSNDHSSFGITSFSSVLPILSWSFYYDTVTICILLLPFFIVLFLPPRFSALYKCMAIITSFLLSFMLLLNMIDIFYFPFHRQRADADLLYVLRNPFQNSSIKIWSLIIIMLLAFTIMAHWCWRSLLQVIQKRKSGILFYTSFFICGIMTASLFTGHSSNILPNRPLTHISTNQLPLTQNSFHCFLYSVFRNKEVALPPVNYLTFSQQNAIFSTFKKNQTASKEKKNIVLFIMESVPYDYFDSSSLFKPSLPFFDSLVNVSTLFTQAYSFGYHSNQGITSILTGIPTLTDIPLYHSGFTHLKKTDLGTALTHKGYQSSFFIGDNYDDFGFAKCCNWVGIQHYYSMQDVPGFQLLKKHTMGLQDEDMLAFMQSKLASQKQPFFSVLYNISTHFPFDIPQAFKKKIKTPHISDAMKAMIYYDDCLQHFFKEAQKQDWYKNSVFIFCSDHWGAPAPALDGDNSMASLRIPIIIFDPQQPQARKINSTVSQLDIMNTVLHYAGTREPFTSFGTALTDTALQEDRVVFSKLNNNLYQATRKKEVLIFSVDEGKAVSCYARNQPKKNLLGTPIAEDLTLHVKAILQSASMLYRTP